MSLRSLFWGSFLLFAGASLISCDRTKSAGNDETTAPVVQESVDDEPDDDSGESLEVDGQTYFGSMLGLHRRNSPPY
ncbi:MAG: hypothetical protein ACQEVA_21230 [Myxococcota bacterium]